MSRTFIETEPCRGVHRIPPQIYRDIAYKLLANSFACACMPFPPSVVYCFVVCAHSPQLLKIVYSCLELLTTSYNCLQGQLLTASWNCLQLLTRAPLVKYLTISYKDTGINVVKYFKSFTPQLVLRRTKRARASARTRSIPTPRARARRRRRRSSTNCTLL